MVSVLQGCDTASLVELFQDFSKDGSSLTLEGEGKGNTILRNSRNRLNSDTVS